MTCRANGGSSCENENSKHRLRAKHRIIGECLPAAKRARQHPLALTNNSTRARIARPVMRTPARRDSPAADNERSPNTNRWPNEMAAAGLGVFSCHPLRDFCGTLCKDSALV